MTTQSQPEKPLAIYHEHPDWFKPLFAELERRGIPYERLDAASHSFDPSAIRLTGNVSGEPPFRGALRHAGWRAVQVKLPAQPSGQDPRIVAPAEVEIP